MKVRFNPIVSTQSFVNDSLFERSIEYRKYRVKFYVDIYGVPTGDYILIASGYIVCTKHNDAPGNNHSIRIYNVNTQCIRRMITFARKQADLLLQEKLTSILSDVIDELIEDGSCTLRHVIKPDKIVDPCTNYAMYMYYKRLGYDGTELLYFAGGLDYVLYPKAAKHEHPNCSYSINLFGEYHGLMIINNRINNYHLELLISRDRISSMLIQTYDRSTIIGRLTKKQNTLQYDGNIYSIIRYYIKGKDTPKVCTTLHDNSIIVWESA
jgi:hypothetical protein